MKVSTHVRTMALLFCASAVLFGCGKKADENAQTTPTKTDSATTTPAPAAAAATDTTKLDFAALDKSAKASSKVDAALAAQGKALFTSKTCVACHAFGKVVLGPDLTGVSKLRGEKWILAQIQHPTVMTAGDPISMKLKDEAVNKTQMLVPGGVTPDEAKALLEYLKTDGK
jgi:mono/diheme cytochrome c family protein